MCILVVVVVYLPGPNDTHSHIAVLFPVLMVRFNRLGDPRKSPNGRGFHGGGVRIAVFFGGCYNYYIFRSPIIVLDKCAISPR